MPDPFHAKDVRYCGEAGFLAGLTFVSVTVAGQRRSCTGLTPVPFEAKGPCRVTSANYGA